MLPSQRQYFSPNRVDHVRIKVQDGNNKNDLNSCAHLANNVQRVSTADSIKNSHRDLAKTNELGLQLWVWVISIYIGLSHRSAKLVNIFQRDQSTRRCEASFHCRNIYHFLNIPPRSFFIKFMILPKWSLKARRKPQDKLASDSVEQRGKNVKAAFPCKSIKAVMQWENTVQLPRKNT